MEKNETAGVDQKTNNEDTSSSVTMEEPKVTHPVPWRCMLEFKFENDIPSPPGAMLKCLEVPPMVDLDLQKLTSESVLKEDSTGTHYERNVCKESASVTVRDMLDFYEAIEMTADHGNATDQVNLSEVNKLVPSDKQSESSNGSENCS